LFYELLEFLTDFFEHCNLTVFKLNLNEEYLVPFGVTKFSEEHILIYFFTDAPTKPGTPEIKDFDTDFVDLEWTRPQGDGGSPITGYIVEKRSKFK